MSDWSWLWILLPELVIVIGAIAYSASEWLLTDGEGALRPWVAERWNPFWDREQSAAVRPWALRLASRRSKVRMEAVERLGESGDRSAVPALVKAIQRHWMEGRLLEAVVDALRRLGDERAIPPLRGLTSGRHYSLMAAAREAVAELEPRSTLLRASDSADSEALLRAAHRGENPDSMRLLRVADGDSRQD